MEIKVQKDAPGSVSPLRVRIFGVWARGAFLNPVFAVFLFSEKSVFEIRVQKDAPGPVSPLRVRIFGVWARGAFLKLRFQRFSFGSNIWCFSQKVPHSGPFNGSKTRAPTPNTGAPCSVLSF